MLAFFRKIRWRLAENNQFFKYSRYAIGEIVLVVIGILIALYINNWNQQRISKSELLDKLIQVKKELEVHSKEMDWHIESRRREDSILRGILNDKFTTADYRDHQYLGLVMLNFIRPKFISNAYNNYHIGTEVKDRELTIISNKLDRLYKISQYDIEVISNGLYDIHSTYKNDLTNTKAWYLDFFNKKNSPEEALTYFANDPFYKNKAYSYFLGSMNLTIMMQEYRTKARALVREIHDYVKEARPFYQDSLLFTYDPNQYKHYVGTYQDSATTVKIFIEQNKLKYFYQVEKEQDTAEIIPVNRRYFNTLWHDGFHYLVFDANDQVEKLQWMRDRVEEYKKVEY